MGAAYVMLMALTSALRDDAHLVRGADAGERFAFDGDGRGLRGVGTRDAVDCRGGHDVDGVGGARAWRPRAKVRAAQREVRDSRGARRRHGGGERRWRVARPGPTCKGPPPSGSDSAFLLRAAAPFFVAVLPSAGASRGCLRRFLEAGSPLAITVPCIAPFGFRATPPPLLFTAPPGIADVR